MGTRYEFSCPVCGYKTVISGGRDRGLEFGTITITCKDCKELSDIRVTGKNEHPGKVFDPEWNLPIFYCSKSKYHSVKEWNNPGPCPKCGKTMKMGIPFEKWD